MNSTELDFDYRQYEFNGSVTASINIDNHKVSESDILYAYIDGELRGQVSPIMFPLTNEYVLPIMIYGNDSNESKIEFEYYSSQLNDYLTIQETIEFSPDMIIGDAINPYDLYQENSSDMPTTYSLGKAYPNPFNPTTTIGFNVGQEGHVSVIVYDVSGRIVDTLVDGYKDVGNHEVRWVANTHPSGVYFVRYSINGYAENAKLMLIK
jgi:hypothetical protein